MGFSLDEIKNIKDNLSDEIFIKQRYKILEKINELKKTLKNIDLIRSNIENNKIKIYDIDINNILTKKKGMSKWDI